MEHAARPTPVEIEAPELAANERARVAALLLAEYGPALRRIARRVSLCDADAEDALQRALEIALRKAPAAETRRLYAWTVVVVRREALAVRRARERFLGFPPAEAAAAGPQAAIDRALWDGPDPEERILRDERVAERVRALSGLRAGERIAIRMQAEGYSYAEIGERCGWTPRKVDRRITKGRARLRGDPDR